MLLRSDGGIMRAWPTGALLFFGWVGLLSIITWKALQVTPGPPYWRVVGVLVGIAATFLLLWLYDYPNILRGLLTLGIAWLLMVPFTPPIADIQLDRQASRIQVGMTETEVRTIMSSYRSSASGFAHADGIVGVAFCTDDPQCETSAQVQFAAGRVVRVWVDTD